MAQYNVYSDDYNEYEGDGKRDGGGGVKGYKVVVMILAVILVAVSGLYFYQSHQLKLDFAIERDTLTGRIMAIRRDLAGLQTSNDSLNVSIAMERGRTDSVLEALAKERRTSRAMIRQYEKELGSLRAAAINFSYQIDSLNKLNARLITENLGMRREITSERLRADAAEERAADADHKIRIGQRIIARDLRLVPLNRNDREVTRVNRAERLRIDFTLSANDLANPGLRSIYTRVTGPDGFVLANRGAATFEFEGSGVIYSAMREVDYQNADIGVSLFYDGDYVLAAGTFHIEVYVDGMLAGSTEMLLR